MILLIITCIFLVSLTLVQALHHMTAISIITSALSVANLIASVLCILDSNKRSDISERKCKEIVKPKIKKSIGGMIRTHEGE